MSNSQNRFYFPDVRFRVIQKGTLLAGFTFVDNETGLEYNDFKLIQGPNGTFVSGPSREYQDREGNTKYSNHVQPAYDKSQENKQSPKGREYFDALHNAVQQKYQQKLNNSGGGQQSSGRGPVNANAGATPGVSTDGSGLPF